MTMTNNMACMPNIESGCFRTTLTPQSNAYLFSEKIRMLAKCLVSFAVDFSQ